MVDPFFHSSGSELSERQRDAASISSSTYSNAAYVALSLSSGPRCTEAAVGPADLSTPSSGSPVQSSASRAIA
jgi:hypothetical protein